MRLLIGWFLRGVFASVLAGFLITMVITDPPWDWQTYWISVATLSALVALILIADYLVDHEEWKNPKGSKK